MVPLHELGALLGDADAAEEWSVLTGRSLLAVDVDAPGTDAVPAALATLPCLTVAVSAGHPAVDPTPFDVLLTPDPTLAARPGWVPVDDPGLALADLGQRAGAQPLATAAVKALLRLTEQLPTWEAVAAESAAYSMLLGSEAFWAWRNSTPVKTPPPPDPAGAVVLRREGDTLYVELNRPEARNAVDRALRDGLVEAMHLVADDPTIEEAVLSGRGASFSAGGDLNEFGTVRDPALAHAVRLTRHPGLAVARCRDKVTAHLHGACMGSGIEIPAFAHRLVAQRDAFFGLPELAMGLMPGAGGTASITARIGRHRTCWLIVSGQRIGAETAEAWGLVDEVVEAFPPS
jgi:hypothetical protein